MNDIILPTSKSPAKGGNPKILILYGPPKVGKTAMLSKLEDTLILDIEEGREGTAHVEALKLRINDAASFKQVAEKISKERPYKRIAIDPIDTLEVWGEIDARTQYMKSPMGANFKGDSILFLDRGAGYAHLRAAVDKLLKLVYNMADEIILIGHVRISKDISSDGVVKSSDLDLTGKIRNIVCSQADAIGEMYRKSVPTAEDKNNTELWVSFKSSEAVTCGSRCPHLTGKEFAFDWSKIYLPAGGAK